MLSSDAANFRSYNNATCFKPVVNKSGIAILVCIQGTAK